MSYCISHLKYNSNATLKPDTVNLYLLYFYVRPPCFLCLLSKSCCREDGEDEEQEVESFEVSKIRLMFLAYNVLMIWGLTF